MSLLPETCTRCGQPLGRLGDDSSCAACLIEALILPAENRNELPCVAGYQLLEEIGRGGMGVIYKACQPGLDRMVAVKMLLSGEFAEARERERLLREAKIASRLAHPNIVTIYEVGEEDGRPFFAMEYVPGRNLSELAREKTISSENAARYLEQLARAVHYAHENGVIHRDLKPANVLISQEGELKLTDFGLTKSRIEPSLTIGSAGTPNFMAPEQANSKLGATGPHTDVFGLGGILYFLLTGRPPFAGETLGETLQSVLEREPIAPRLLRPAVPRDLETICLKCLEKAPARRYESALEVADELARWRSHQPIRARPAGPVERVRKWVKRRPAIATLSAACLLVLIFGIASVTWQWQRAETHRAAAELENYAASLQLAQQHILEGNVERARELLFAQPERLRHVEWGRLAAQCFPTLGGAALPGWVVNEPWRMHDGRVASSGEFFVTWQANVVHLWRTRDGAEIARRGGASEPAGPASFSPDGKSLLISGPGHGFSMWEVETGNLRFKGLPGERRPLWVEFCPRGRYFATAGSESPSRLWDAKTGELIRQLDDPGRAITWLTFSSDGERISSARESAAPGLQQTIWDVESGRIVAHIPFEPENYIQSTISSGKLYFAAVSLDQSVEVWKLGGTEPEFRTPPGNGPYSLARVTSDGKRLVAGRAGKDEVDFWNVPERRLIKSSGERVTSWQFIAEEKLLLTGGTERFMRVWDLEWGEQVHQINTGQTAAGQAMHLASNGRFVLSLGADHSAAVAPIASLDTQLRYATWAVTAAMSRDQTRLAAPYPGGKLLLWDLASQTATHLHGHRHWVIAAEFSPDGRRLYSTAADNTVRMWDVATSRLLATAAHHSRSIFGLHLSRDGSKLVSTDRSGKVCFLDPQTLELRRSFQINVREEDYFLTGLHPSGEAFLGRVGTELIEWNATNGEENWRMPLPDPFVYFGAFYSADGASILTVNFDRLELWRRDPLRRVAAIQGRAAFGRPEFTPDGQRLLIGSSDSGGAWIGTATVEVRDARTLKLLVSLSPVPGAALNVRLASDQRLISRTRINTSILGVPTDLWRVFPWHDGDYSDYPGEMLEHRVAAFARQQWQPILERSVDLARVAPLEEWIPLRTEWPLRDPATPARCIDLTAAFNRWLDSTPQFVHFDNLLEDHLAELPRGLVTFEGIPFDVRGITMGAAETTVQARPFQPRDTSRIPVGQKCRQLHFLHVTAGFHSGRPLVARYRLRYANGETRDLEVQLGRDIFNTWGTPGEVLSQETPARIVWRGRNPAASQSGQEIRLFLRTWENPLPEVEITSFDFISERSPVNPMLIAVTLE